MVTTVYLIRHCEAAGNVEGVFQGHTDGDITERGALQLERLKIRCREIPFDVVYSSPLIRAKKTAQAANYYAKAPLIVENDLIEINGGDMEGLKWADLPVKYPELFSLWRENFAAFAAPNGESSAELYKRVKSCVLKLVEENKGKTIGIVSHGGALYTFFAYINGYKAEEISNLDFWADNAAVTRVDFHENNHKLVYFNDCSHINSSPETSAQFLLW